MISNNLRAFLDTIAHSEIGASLLEITDDGYDVIVGSTPKKPILFSSYADHPRRLIDLGKGLKSTAAGRYQILARYWDVYKRQLNLPDFGHDSQDAVAIQLIRECKALQAIEAGLIPEALTLCRSRWASLPGSPYGQHTNTSEALIAAYVSAGGDLA